jgi:hypothetical protein
LKRVEIGFELQRQSEAERVYRVRFGVRDEKRREEVKQEIITYQKPKRKR